MIYSRSRMIAALSAALLLSQLAACSGAARDRIKTLLKPANKYLSRVVEPLDYDYKNEPAKAKDGADKANATYYYLIGQHLSQQGDASQALTAFDRAKSFDPESAAIHLALSQEYLKLNMMEEGVAAARKSLEIDPKSREAKLLLANLYATAKKYDEAVDLFEQVQKVYPDDEEVMLYLALIEIEQKEYSKAEHRLHAFLAANPDSALTQFYLGRLAQEQGHRKEALESYQRAIDVRPGFVQAGSYMAALQEEGKDTAGAIKTYEWLAEETDEANYYKKLGQLLLDGGDYPNALKAFQNFDRVEHGNLNNRMRIGLIYLELKDYPKASAALESVLKDSPDSENVRYYLAAVYEQQKKFKEALNHYEKISSTSKLFPDALKRRIFLLGELKKKDQAWKLFLSAMNKPAESPKDAKISLLDKDGKLAQAKDADEDKDDDKDSDKEASMTREDFYELGVQYLDNYEEATPQRTDDFLAQGIKEFPGSEKLLYLQGTLLEKRGKIDEAVAVMQKILDRNPDHAGALNFVGYLWADHGEHLDKAEKMVKKALKLRPKDPFITDSLAWVYYKSGKHAESLKLLEEAYAARPDEPVIAEHLGDVLVKLGRFDQAKTYYEMAIKLGPQKDSDKKKIEDKLAQVASHLSSKPHSASVLNPRTPAAQ